MIRRTPPAIGAKLLGGGVAAAGLAATTAVSCLLAAFAVSFTFGAIDEWVVALTGY